MTKLTLSRRFVLSVFAITCITLIGVVNKVDTSMAIAMVAGAVAASNAWQKKTPAP